MGNPQPCVRNVSSDRKIQQKQPKFLIDHPYRRLCARFRCSIGGRVQVKSRLISAAPTLFVITLKKQRDRRTKAPAKCYFDQSMMQVEPNVRWIQGASPREADRNTSIGQRDAREGFALAKS